MILLVSSCQSTNYVMGDLSIKYNRCRIRCYNIDLLETVPEFNCDKKLSDNFPVFYDRRDNFLKFISGNYPLEVCDQLIGFYANDFAKKIKPQIRKAKDACMDQENFKNEEEN